MSEPTKRERRKAWKAYRRLYGWKEARKRCDENSVLYSRSDLISCLIIFFYIPVYIIFYDGCIKVWIENDGLITAASFLLAVFLGVGFVLLCVFANAYLESLTFMTDEEYRLYKVTEEKEAAAARAKDLARRKADKDILDDFNSRKLTIETKKGEERELLTDRMIGGK